ncbi:hypothetical protein [Paenarthrobacter sp. YJN-5]|uniref:hypothetical protein n=1 Tax=Paenarthrobacter sp. YJN-5 TaxID=2735316 RepID=UPI0018779B23|nr:hypothetical protein [Paenarthrobacter sp. YJN-5]QOT20022.1 hypothetical protein HMI59_25590 [Paenarthrobacter sp. YJN-5]
MNHQQKKSGIVQNSAAGAIGGVVGAGVIAYFVAIWTGTVSGPQNPAFGRDVAPFVVGVVVVILLAVRQTRRLIFSISRPLKRLAIWLSGIRVYDKTRREALVIRGVEEALAEVARRNATSTKFTISYLPDSPLDGDWFSLTDYSGIGSRGQGPMTEIHISAPTDQIEMPEKDGPTIPGDNPEDPYDFSGRVTDHGHLHGVNFRVLSKDKDGYPRCNFYRVGPTGQTLKGVRTGVPGQIQYGPLVTNSNISDGTLSVEWTSTGQVMGRLVPSGNTWIVESGRCEGRLSQVFIVEDELGVASTAADGVHLLRTHAEQDD